MGEQPNAALFFRKNYLPFDKDDCYLGKGVRPAPKFDMSFVHLRYDQAAIDGILKEGTKKFTILRFLSTSFICMFSSGHICNLETQPINSCHRGRTTINCIYKRVNN